MSGKHELKEFAGGEVTLVSHQYPYCATGAIDDDNSLRSGFSLVPFAKQLNRLTLTIRGNDDKPVKITWGSVSKVFTPAEVASGINLAEAFDVNPFSEAFAKLDAAVLAKQTFETKQVKQIFHGKQGKENFEKAVADTEAERKPLAEAVAAAVVPVEHVIKIEVQ